MEHQKDCRQAHIYIYVYPTPQRIRSSETGTEITSGCCCSGVNAIGAIIMQPEIEKWRHSCTAGLTCARARLLNKSQFPRTAAVAVVRRKTYVCMRTCVELPREDLFYSAESSSDVSRVCVVRACFFF